MPPLLKRVAKRVALVLPVVGPYVRDHDRLRASRPHPPGHYYSPIPDLEDVKAREAEIWRRDNIEGIPGIDLNEDGQLRLLDELMRYYPEQPFSEHKKAGLRYYFANEFFSFSDGIFYHCMIRYLRPKRVCEIGCGFSSCVLLDTNDLFFDSAIRCTFIDPEPQRLYELMKPGDAETIEVLPKRLQDVDLGFLGEFRAGDILFVDSSHVSKPGSEVNLLLFEILPTLAPGVRIHIHDVFYPFEYPREYVYRGWAYNELYMLRAFLCYNQKFRIAMFPSYIERFHGERLQRTLPLAWKHPPLWPTMRGGGIWLEHVQS